jgi:resuscitation-promoting factor RpfB
MRLKAFMAAFAVATVFAVANTGSASAQNQNETPKPNNIVVQPGDTLSKIATAHATTYTRLYDANTQIAHPDVIHPGDNIRIPTPEEQLASRPLPTPPQPVAAAPKAAVAKPRAVSTVNDGSVWGRLAACESGGNPATNTGNGYYGAYQFSLSTWRSVGGSGLPSDASMAEQTARAQTLQARSGWGQWPACSAKLGLR